MRFCLDWCAYVHAREMSCFLYFPLICVLGKDEEASSSVLNWNPYTSSIAPCYATPASEGNQGESGWIYLSGLRVDLFEPVQWGLDDKHTRISLSQLRSLGVSLLNVSFIRYVTIMTRWIASAGDGSETILKLLPLSKNNWCEFI
jgi:hypothetical protein